VREAGMRRRGRARATRGGHAAPRARAATGEPRVEDVRVDHALVAPRSSNASPTASKKAPPWAHGAGSGEAGPDAGGSRGASGGEGGMGGTRGLNGPRPAAARPARSSGSGRPRRP
jgi:hypothetical protein